MFQFTLYDRFKQKGLSLDLISPEMRNRFNARFHDQSIDNRIQVRLDARAVRFFFYDHSDTESILEDKYKEVASVSLTNRKETGQDVLYLKKQIETKCGVLDNIHLDWTKLSKDLLGNGAFWNDFPFVDEFDINGKNSDQEWFAFFVQCCFLFFVNEYENRESDFSYSPLYDEVRQKLRDSVVYQLLCAKTRLAVYLYHDEPSYSEEEYTFKTQKFVDLLMDKRINKIIPPYYYSDSLWLYNPEVELDLIVGRNNSARKRKGEARLNVKLQSKIRDYFFAHHAVVSAMGTPVAKALYSLYIIIVGAYSVWATYSLLFFDDVNNPIANPFFDSIILWDYLTVASLVFLAIMAVIKGVNVFMPRVLVALGIGWLTAFISEDLVKSQLEIRPVFTIVACFGVLFLVTAMLFSEAKQHSPYYMLKFFKLHFLRLLKFSSLWKLIPILVHSYFWALTIGVMMQFALYDDLLKNSNALPEIVYESAFEEAKSYVICLNNLKGALEDCQNYMDSRSVRATVRGVTNNAGLGSFIDAKVVYSDGEYQKMMTRRSTRIETIKKRFQQVCQIERVTVENTIELCGAEIDGENPVYMEHALFGGVLLTDFNAQLEEFSIDNVELEKKYVPKRFDDFLNQQIYLLDELISEVDYEIRNVELYISQNYNYDTLIGWSTQNNVHEVDVVDYCDYIRYGRSHQRFLCRKVEMYWVDSSAYIKKNNNMHLFPRMLIFHSLIVLIIAFVGQLIISDKSVTEPL